MDKIQEKKKEITEECVPKKTPNYSNTKTRQNINLAVNSKLKSKIKRKQRLATNEELGDKLW